MGTLTQIKIVFLHFVNMKEDDGNINTWWKHEKPIDSLDLSYRFFRFIPNINVAEVGDLFCDVGS